MSKVDWSLAPEDATHFGPSNKDWESCWMKKIGNRWYGWLYPTDTKWDYLADASSNQSRISMLVKRPQPKPWSGPEDGLPPVGLECEVDHGNGKHWDKVTIVAHHCEKAIYLDPVRGIHYIWGLVKDFRTVRTPDQIASDARETAIRELMDIAQVDCRVTAARLVDAGFKLPSKSESRDNAVDAMELIVPHIGSVAAGKLYDAGFKRVVV